MKRGNVQRKVGDIMGGRVLDLDIVVAHRNGIAEGIEQGREEGVKGIVAVYKNLGGGELDVVEAVVTNMGLSEDEARVIVKKYW